VGQICGVIIKIGSIKKAAISSQLMGVKIAFKHKYPEGLVKICKTKQENFESMIVGEKIHLHVSLPPSLSCVHTCPLPPTSLQLNSIYILHMCFHLISYLNKDHLETCSALKELINSDNTQWIPLYKKRLKFHVLNSTYNCKLSDVHERYRNYSRSNIFPNRWTMRQRFCEIF